MSSGSRTRLKPAVLLVILLSIGAVTAVAIKWFGREPDQRVDFGRHGGMRIVYSLDVDQAVDDRASELKRDLEARLADEHLAGMVKTPVSPPGALTVVLVDATRRATLEAAIRADYGDTIELRPCAPADGPLAICFRVTPSYAAAIKQAALASAVTTIRKRMDEVGRVEPSVFQRGDQIIVELPGVDPATQRQMRDLIARTAKLEFKAVDNNAAFMRKLYAHVGSDGSQQNPTDARAIRDQIRAEIDQWRPEDGSESQVDYYLIARDREEAITVDEARTLQCIDHRNHHVRTGDPAVIEGGKVRCEVSGRHVIERYLQDLANTDPQWAVPDDRQIGYERIDAGHDDPDQRLSWRTYFLDRAVRLTGSSIANATGSYDPNTNRPIVLLDFSRGGSQVFGDLTAELVGKKLATILDDRVTSAPIILGAIRGGRASITMGGSDPRQQEAERDALVNVLRSGSLPAPLREESVVHVGPTLGR